MEKVLLDQIIENIEEIEELIFDLPDVPESYVQSLVHIRNLSVDLLYEAEDLYDEYDLSHKLREKYYEEDLVVYIRPKLGVKMVEGPKALQLVRRSFITDHLLSVILGEERHPAVRHIELAEALCC